MTTTKPVAVLQALTQALQQALRFNTGVQVAPACILWPDKEGQWLSALPMLREQLPQLLTLGEYAPQMRCGPAIWLKSAIAGLLPDGPGDSVPVLYLPGVSRVDLRAIESCPRALQPLAELQYRGVFWSQANAKDWTVSAFLSSKNGGLGLELAQDKATQEALSQALETGVLLEQSVSALQGRAINAEWLLGLLAPNPMRDLLQWMNAPEAVRQQWSAVLWDVFAKRCKADFGFDPLADGVLTAAELLASRDGKWGMVWALYQDSFASFPNIYALLEKVAPPQLGLFPDQKLLSGYPQVNEQNEVDLRRALSDCVSMDAAQARTMLAAVELEHGTRRSWVWARMGYSPLAIALEHLARVAQQSTLLPIGQTPTELADSYQQMGWQVDQAALHALAAVHTKADVEAVGLALRAMYLPWLDEAARRLQEAVKKAGGLHPAQGADKPGVEGVCTVFVDGLRYDVAKLLEQRLSALGPTRLSAGWTSMPSVTASGKAWCSPVAAFIAGSAGDIDFQPRVKADGRPLSGHNFRKLLGDHGIQALDRHERGDSQGSAWTEAGDLDHYGHAHGIRLARDMDTQLNQVVERVAELLDSGWRHVRSRLAADAGGLA